MPQRHSIGRTARQCTHLTRRSHERGRLGGDQAEVLVLRVGDVVVGEELPHFAHAHPVRRGAQHPHGFEVAQARKLRDRTAVQVVTHDDRDLVRPDRVHRRHAAAEDRMVDGIVVHERCDVYKFDGRGQGNRVVTPLALDLAAEQQQSGAEQLARYLQQIVVDLVDHREVGHRDAPQFVHHAVQALPNRCLYAGKASWSRLQCSSPIHWFRARLVRGGSGAGPTGRQASRLHRGNRLRSIKIAIERLVGI